MRSSAQRLCMHYSTNTSPLSCVCVCFLVAWNNKTWQEKMCLRKPEDTGLLALGGSRGLGLVMIRSDLPWRLERNSPSNSGIVGNST
eukprot:2633848-Amphidinium_carterae.1